MSSLVNMDVSAQSPGGTETKRSALMHPTLSCSPGRAPSRGMQLAGVPCPLQERSGSEGPQAAHRIELDEINTRVECRRVAFYRLLRQCAR